MKTAQQNHIIEKNMEKGNMKHEPSVSCTIEHGSYIIIPLKFEGEISRIIRLCEKSGLIHTKITSMDFNDIFKSMLNSQIKNPVGLVYTLPSNLICQIPDCSQNWIYDKHKYKFTKSYLYIFHTNVAFLCIGITYNSIEALNALCNPGRPNQWNLIFESVPPSKAKKCFDLNESIQNICSQFNLDLFFENSPALLDNYTYSIALTDHWFNSTKEIEKKTYKLHQMISMDSTIEDDSEDDIKYVFSKKDERMDSYRWGCCIASQYFTHIIAKCNTGEYGEYESIESTLKEESNNTLPIIVFSLYERYTCLRFTRALNNHLNHKAQLNKLKKSMLAFKAYGTFPSIELSRYYNIKQIYRHLSDVNDIDESIDDVEAKLNLIMDHQQEASQKKNDWLSFFITIFGAVSIIESAQSIAQNITSETPFMWEITVSSLLLIVLIIAVSRFRR